MDKKTPKIIEEAKQYQRQIIADYGRDPYNLLSHFKEMESWAEKLLQMFPEADRQVVLLAVWLHDSGHYKGDPEIDHAIKSEKIAREFLADKLDKKTLDRVCNAVRAHRCKDVQPKKIEERIIACIDSVSHMTDSMYIDIVKEGRFNYCMGKIERDFRDAGLIPEIKEMVEPIYRAWKELINRYAELEIVEIKD